jgi:gluconokinase
MKHVIAIDLGTTNIKAVVFDEHLSVVASAQKSCNTYRDLPGQAEQDPDEILQVFFQVLTAVISKFEDPLSIEYIAFSSAMHSLIVVDSDHKALTRCLLWSDNRAACEVRKFKNTNDWLAHYQRTGTPIHAMSPFFKLMWLKNNTEILAKAGHIISIKDYIIYHLTGRYITDYSLASATGMFNIHTLKWDQPALDILDISEKLLPELADVDAELKVTNQDLIERFAFAGDVKLILGASDGCLANLGSGALSRGETTLTIGTSGAVRMTVNKPLLDAQGRTFCYYLARDKWIIGGAVNNGGNVIAYLDSIIDNGNGDIYQRLEQTVGGIEPGSEGLMFVPYLFGERAPRWDGSLTASYLGITARHTKDHFLRAALEGISFNLREVWQLLESVTGRSTKISASGGFLKSQVWSQIIADVFGRDIEVSDVIDGSCLGAAMLSGFKKMSDNELNRGIIRPDLMRSNKYHNLYKQYLEWSQFIYCEKSSKQ